LIAGPSCDRFGPRYTFAGCLLLGAIPTALAGTVNNIQGLLIIRFFIGILGGSFVPCQVWSTGFFDKNIVGTANALTGGLGNAGGGITYFLMPAIFDSLVERQGLSHNVAWRVSFIVPFIVITATAIAMIVFCPDTPTGKWSERHLATKQNLVSHGVTSDVITVPGNFTDKQEHSPDSHSVIDPEKGDLHTKKSNFDLQEVNLDQQQTVDMARGELIRKPTFKEALPVLLSLQTLVTCGAYFCSFGGELAINSVLGSYYTKNFPYLGQTNSGKWAAMFGLLNVVFRPAGGLLSDIIYKRTNVWGKKWLLHALAFVTGAFQLAIGFTNPHNEHAMFGLIAGMAFFMDAGNGANFSLVPHVHPHANGIVSGCTGASGNFGGIIFAVVFRVFGKDYAKTFWIIGAMTIGINLALVWIKPIPEGQIGGR